jgi:hypothetical protein
MAARHSTPLQSALRRLLGDRDLDREHDAPSASGARRRRDTRRKAPMSASSNGVQREMDWYRRGQGLPYWHHDRRSD